MNTPATLIRYAMTRLDWLRLINQGFKISIAPPAPPDIGWKYRRKTRDHERHHSGFVIGVAREMVREKRVDPDSQRAVAARHSISLDSLRYAVYRAKKEARS